MISKDLIKANQLIYNITIKLNNSISDVWLADMQEKFLPACIDGLIIVSAQINRILLEDQDEDITFAIQFTFSTIALFEKEGIHALSKFIKALDSIYRGQYVYFTTKMEVLYYNRLPSYN